MVLTKDQYSYITSKFKVESQKSADNSRLLKKISFC